VGSDDPEARCPKCAMRLEPREEVLTRAGTSAPHEGRATPASLRGERKVIFYRNPMNPAITSPVPMKDEMGMDYVPVYEGEAPASSGVEGMALVEVTPEAARLAGVQTAPVEREGMGRAIRTVGTVVPDETRVRHVHTKIAGWVERLHVNFTGQHVRTGQPILALYSQELLASQEELLRAREAAARFAASELPEVRRGGEDLVRAARRRLELFDVPPAFVTELERTGTPQRAVTLTAPVSGYVTAKGVFEGQQVEPGMELFTITDLSRVWIEADFYEYEAAALALGQTATLSLPYDPATVLEGRIAYVYPTLAIETRTLRVRFEFPNPDTALKPGMFANVELAAGDSEGLVIPDSAVLDTGTRRLVFVATGPGRFEPREVRVGVRSAGKAEVLSGLAEGEQVVIKANFLLDSESRLRAAYAAATAGAPAAKAPAPEEAGHVH
jgi:multidrug efflux pump subunit AcrA (membrane-fusion protein)